MWDDGKPETIVNCLKKFGFVEKDNNIQNQQNPRVMLHQNQTILLLVLIFSILSIHQCTAASVRYFMKTAVRSETSWWTMRTTEMNTQM